MDCLCTEWVFLSITMFIKYHNAFLVSLLTISILNTLKGAKK